MRLMKSMIAMLLALAAMVVQAGESAEFRLDTMDGSRVARAVETIVYSTAWNNGGTVSVAVDGVAIKEVNAPASDDVVWNAAQATSGTHTLTHTCGGETLAAVFEVPNPPSPMLTVETADWTDGTITLRCEDANVGIANAPFYNLSYFDTAKNEWRDIDRDDLLMPSPVVEVNADGVEVLTTRITDRKFARRNNGVGTVRYRIVDDENSARTATRVTRNRHGLFVAVGEYEDARVKPLPTPKMECSVFRDAYVRYGKGNGICQTLNVRPTKFVVLASLDSMVDFVAPGDIFVFYFAGHGRPGFVCCHDYNSDTGAGKIAADDLAKHLNRFCDGAGLVAVIYSCFSSGMFIQDTAGLNSGRIGWIFSSQSNETTRGGSLTDILCHDGWLNGRADVYNGGYGVGDGDGYVTFWELAEYGYEWTSKNDYDLHRQQMWRENTFVLGSIVAGEVPSNSADDRKWKWLAKFLSVFSSSNGDVSIASVMPAANGCRTVGECYALGIDPEDPNDDFRIKSFRMEGAKPIITVNHTEDGSGESFLPRMRTLGKAELSDEWQEVTEEGNSDHRFFTVTVDLP